MSYEDEKLIESILAEGRLEERADENQAAVSLCGKAGTRPRRFLPCASHHNRIYQYKSAAVGSSSKPRSGRFLGQL